MSRERSLAEVYNRLLIRRVKIARYYYIGVATAMTALSESGLTYLSPGSFGEDADSKAITLLHEAIHQGGKKRLCFPRPKTGGRFAYRKGRFDAARKKAGINDFRFHELRHAAATHMADA